MRNYVCTSKIRHLIQRRPSTNHEIVKIRVYSVSRDNRIVIVRSTSSDLRELRTARRGQVSCIQEPQEITLRHRDTTVHSVVYSRIIDKIEPLSATPETFANLTTFHQFMQDQHMLVIDRGQIVNNRMNRALNIQNWTFRDSNNGDARFVKQ